MDYLKSLVHRCRVSLLLHHDEHTEIQHPEEKKL